MKTEYKFQIERVADKGLWQRPVDPNLLRLIIHEAYDGLVDYMVFDIIQSDAGQTLESFRRLCKRITLAKANMDAEDFSFLWKRALRAAKAKNR